MLYLSSLPSLLNCGLSVRVSAVNPLLACKCCWFSRRGHHDTERGAHDTRGMPRISKYLPRGWQDAELFVAEQTWNLSTTSCARAREAMRPRTPNWSGWGFGLGNGLQRSAIRISYIYIFKLWSQHCSAGIQRTRRASRTSLRSSSSFARSKDLSVRWFCSPLCRYWTEMFRKQIDNLRTNHKVLLLFCARHAYWFDRGSTCYRTTSFASWAISRQAPRRKPLRTT
jgi:hypothetical protein